jgi:photosystem II stability/assembly factor-like uncharacterized protein
MYKTTDGGENWILQSSNDSFSVNSLFFINADTGWAVGSRRYVPG